MLAVADAAQYRSCGHSKHCNMRQLVAPPSVVAKSADHHVGCQKMCPFLSIVSHFLMLPVHVSGTTETGESLL